MKKPSRETVQRVRLHEAALCVVALPSIFGTDAARDVASWLLEQADLTNEGRLANAIAAALVAYADAEDREGR